MQQVTNAAPPVDVLGLIQDKIDAAPETGLVPHWCEAREALAELIAADREYDSAIAALKNLNRQIEERGWLEVRFEELRQAGERVVAAQERRRLALDRISPTEAEG